MIFDRYLIPEDLPILKASLAADPYHAETTTDFFQEDGSITKVYFDEHGSILFVRAAVVLRFDKKVLRLDIQFVSNEDTKRNARAMLWGFDTMSQRAKQNGFDEIYFFSNSPLLKAFCTKRFGFVQSGDELRKTLST